MAWSKINTNKISITFTKKMANDKLKAGDTVNLNSGSPLMTIREITNAGKEARCIWFSDGEVKVAFFPIECLKKGEDPTITGMVIS